MNMLINHQIKVDKARKAKKAAEEKAKADAEALRHEEAMKIADQVMDTQAPTLEKLAQGAEPVENTEGQPKPRGDKNGNRKRDKV